MSEIMQRPFPVRFETTGPPDTLEVSVVFQTPADQTAKDGVQEVLTTFTKLGEVGGLAGEKLAPSQSGMTLNFSRVTSQETHWGFQNVKIDPRSIFILLNMIHYIHLENIPLKDVRIAWPALKQLKDPMAIEFPEQWPQLSFALDIGEMLDDIDVVIDLEQPQDDSTIEKIIETMSVWLLATHRGAYADDSFDPSKSAVFLGPDVMELSPARIVWFIEIMRCSENALDGFFNVLEWVHQNIARIKSVELGP
jgi:hypothetical protein